MKNNQEVRLFLEENSNFELGMRRVFLNIHSPCFLAELTSIIFFGVKVFRVSTLITQAGYYKEDNQPPELFDLVGWPC